MGLLVEGVKKDFRAKEVSFEGSYCRMVTRVVSRRPRRQQREDKVKAEPANDFQHYSAWDFEDS